MSDKELLALMEKIARSIPQEAIDNMRSVGEPDDFDIMLTLIERGEAVLLDGTT